MRSTRAYIVASISLAILLGVAGVSCALPVGYTVRYDHLYENQVQEVHYLRIDALGDASVTSTDGLVVTLSVDDSLGYDEWTVTVGGTAYVTPWDGQGELMTVTVGDGRIVRLKQADGFARDERETTAGTTNWILSACLGAAAWVVFIAGVRRFGWEF